MSKVQTVQLENKVQLRKRFIPNQDWFFVEASPAKMFIGLVKRNDSGQVVAVLDSKKDRINESVWSGLTEEKIGEMLRLMAKGRGII